MKSQDSPVAHMYDVAKSSPPVSERDQLIVNNLGLVHSAVRRICGCNDDDAIQNGMMGLIRAANSYDPTRAKFSTYAWWCIVNSIVGTWKKEQKHAATTLPEHYDKADLQAVQPLAHAIENEAAERRRALLSKALSAMSELDRAAVVAYYWRGETLREIGDRWGVTKERIRQRIQFGIRKACRTLGISPPLK